LNPYGNLVPVQVLQESELVFKTALTVTIEEGATKGIEVKYEEIEEGESGAPRTRRGSRKLRENGFQEQPLPGEGFCVFCWARLLLKIHPFH